MGCYQSAGADSSIDRQTNRQANKPDVERAAISQLQQTVAETADKLLVIVARPQHQRTVSDELVQSGLHIGLIQRGVERARQLVEYRPVQRLVDAVQ